MGRAVRSLPAGLDQTKPQTLYLIYPQPYGSGLSDHVKGEFCDPLFLFNDPGDAENGDGKRERSVCPTFRRLPRPALLQDTALKDAG